MNENETNRVPREFWAELYHQTGLVGGLYDTKPTKSYEIIKVHEVFDEPVDPYTELKKAHKKGKVIQCANKGIDNWDDCVKPLWIDTLQYRIKPEPKYRSWTAEEVPVGAIIKHKNDTVHRYLILDVDKEGVTVTFRNSLKQFETIHIIFNFLGSWHDYSLDHGKTWLPCGVLEE